MCGQFGCAGSIGVPEEKAFQRLAIYNSVRGLDSAGAASVKRHLENGKPKIVVAKEEGHPFELFLIRRKGQTNFDDVLSGQQRAMLGHCRSKTVGLANRRNAHPFKFETILGTHNGTLSYQTNSNLTGFKLFDTDSEALFYEIEKSGIEKTVPMMRRASSQIGVHPDAYAIVWYDTKDNSINFLRNKERPLYLAFSEDHTKLFWSSERVHLHAALNGDGCTIPHAKEYIHCLPEDTHFSWVIPESNQKFGKARSVRREGTPDPLVSAHTGSVLGAYRSGQNHTGTNGTQTGANNYSPLTCGVAPWGPNPHTGFWERWNANAYGYLYAVYKGGPWYNTQQKAWDSMTLEEQNSRIDKGQYPVNIKLGKSSEKSNHPDLEDAINLSSASAAKTEERKKLSPNHTAKMNAINDRFQKFAKGNVPKVKLWEDPPTLGNLHRKVFWNPELKEFVCYDFKGFQYPPDATFELSFHEICPEFVPFTKVDINANHAFKHTGRKKRKVITYRGYNGAMLVQQAFENIMAGGCIQCKRSPEWGNLVQFVSHEDFFCEFCSRDESTVNLFRTGTNN